MHTIAVILACALLVGCNARNIVGYSLPYESQPTDKLDADGCLQIDYAIALIAKTHRYNVVTLRPDAKSGYDEVFLWGHPKMLLPVAGQVGPTRYDSLNDLCAAIKLAPVQGIRCLCSPDYICGVRAMDEQGKTICFLYLSINHNSIHVISAEGNYKDFRYQESTTSGDSIASVRNTLDMQPLLNRLLAESGG